MKNIPIASLISSLEKKLLPRFKDEILCNQYSWWLLQAITGKNDIALISNGHIELGINEENQLNDAIDKLINQNMPLQYLLGSTPFAGLDILIKPPVLIPRPETEEWTITLIEQLKPIHNEPLWILDLCTGSGCIALALADAFPKAKVYGTDISDGALSLAQENARHNHIPNVEFIRSNLFDQIPAHFTFDLIVGNPPYIASWQWDTLDNSVKLWEDKNALIAQDDGLALIKKIIKDAPSFIKSNKALQSKKIPQLTLEIDSTQGIVVTNYMKEHYYNHICIQQDLAGKDRVVSGRIDDMALTTIKK